MRNPVEDDEERLGKAEEEEENKVVADDFRDVAGMCPGELEEGVKVLLDVGVEVEVWREDEPVLELEVEVEETTGFVDLEEEGEVLQNSKTRPTKKVK